MSHFAFDHRQQGLLAAGAMALPLMLVFAASIGDMPVSYASTGKAILNGLGLTSCVAANGGRYRLAISHEPGSDGRVQRRRTGVVRAGVAVDPA